MVGYYRYTLNGRHTPEAAVAVLGASAAHGLVVRIDATDKETHVIIAADTAPHQSYKLSDAVQIAGEVTEEDVRRAP
jgi:3-dehydroquinate dehydratase